MKAPACLQSAKAFHSTSCVSVICWTTDNSFMLPCEVALAVICSFGAVECRTVMYLLCVRMSRDQRVKDNWALLYACEVAARSGSPVAVAFNLVGRPPLHCRFIEKNCECCDRPLFPDNTFKEPGLVSFKHLFALPL